ncbi:hypothetical protein [Microvirga alba]|uniref:Winged helix-turn-helix domain-containing protein n=1 Tax=Microvirga alba TaxID=2791025 RepID=A0A931BTW7_9HYPH|nr:hypothetical protein [Microvirga alba]MBF9234674.1 hypothetical protein [Microvirga alba]
MPTPPLSDEELLRSLEVRNRHRTLDDAARELGITRSTLQNRLLRAAERGLDGSTPVKIPLNQKVKGISTLTDVAGNVILQWTKTTTDEKAAAVESAIRDAFERYRSPAILPAPTGYTDESLLVVYPVVDLHLGLFSWAKETGEDYDLKIAADLLRSSVSNLVGRAAPARTALILDMGDYFHTDNSKNQTARSGNPLDVDTRYGKVAQVGVELAVEVIELALQKHERVEYRKLPGNHDDETSLMLAIALAAWFRDNPRVSISTDPSRFFMKQFGLCMVAATHGDMLKMGDMAGYMAAKWPREWGETEHRYGYTGHVHHDRVKAGNGVRLESFNTLAAKDAWHAGEGYMSPRSMVSITLHRDYGEVDRLTACLPMLKRAA